MTRSHKNTRRLTAKERARVIGNRWNPLAWKGLADDTEKALQAHAREAVARYKRKHMLVCDHMIATAKEAGQKR